MKSRFLSERSFPLQSCRSGVCVLLAALASSACASRTAAAPSPPTVIVSPPVAAARVLEAKSEALHNACAAADWAYARRLVNEVREDWISIAPSASQGGASPALLGMVEGALPLAHDAVDRHARRACTSNANGLSLAAAALDESNEARLRAWLRRVEIDGEYLDFDAATRDIGHAEAAWSNVRPSLVPSSVDQVDAAMAACHGATDEHDSLALRHASHAAMNAIDSANRR